MDFNPKDLPEEQREEILAQAALVGEAWTFLRAFYRGDLITAWGTMHPVLRLCWAQWWSDANRRDLRSQGYEVEETAEKLSQNILGAHPLWEDFSRVILRDFRATYPLDIDAAAIGSTPRIIALDTELVYVHPNSPAGGLWQEGESREVYPLVMRLRENKWLVLNWASDTIPTPGYPPSLS